MKFTGVLQKMSALPDEDSVQYYLNMHDDIIHVNEWLGDEVELRFIRYQCLSCHKEKKISRSGYCYDCANALPQTGDWVIHPELSKAHLDIEDRDLEYEKRVQLHPHILYLSNTGNVKVGVTRLSQIPTRWIDQGAHEAVSILEAPNRYLAGIAEAACKKHFPDKTNRKLMLTAEEKPTDWNEWINKVTTYIPEEARPYIITHPEPVRFHYPVLQRPAQVKAIKLDDSGYFKGTLKGIKGQYWIFSGGYVWNVRSHEGFEVQIDHLN